MTNLSLLGVNLETSSYRRAPVEGYCRHCIEFFFDQSWRCIMYLYLCAAFGYCNTPNLTPIRHGFPCACVTRRLCLLAYFLTKKGGALTVTHPASPPCTPAINTRLFLAQPTSTPFHLERSAARQLLRLFFIQRLYRPTNSYVTPFNGSRHRLSLSCVQLWTFISATPSEDPVIQQLQRANVCPVFPSRTRPSNFL